MGILSRLIRNAVSDGISKGIRDAVGKAAESIVAPKAEAYANKVADSLDTAAKEAEAAKTEGKETVSSLEASLNSIAQSLEQYAGTLEQAEAPKEDFVKEWAEKLPGFPVWCFGGTDYELSENGNTSDGNPYILFDAENASYEGLSMYVLLLKKEGFVRVYKDSDDTLYKDIGGDYLVFSKTEAFNSAPHMTIAMFRTKDRKEFDQ